MAFLLSQLTLLFIAAAASLAAGFPPYFVPIQGRDYIPADYYPNSRYSRSAPEGSAASTSGPGASSYAGSVATSSSGTHVAAGPGGSGAFNAFAGTGPANDFGQPGFGGPAGFGQPGYGYGGGYGGYGGYGGFPSFSFPSFDFSRFFQDFQEAQRKAQEAAASGNGVYNEGPGYVVWASQYPGETRSVFSTYGGSGSSNEVDVGATASGEYSPHGGYGGASVFPGAPQGLDVNFGGVDRFGGGAASGPVNSVSGGFAPPGGSHYGVFTSSSSHTSNVDGKVTSHKTATVGVNDNGKVTTYTAHDP